MPLTTLKIWVLACLTVHTRRKFSCFHFAIACQTDVDKNPHPQENVFHYFSLGDTVTHFLCNRKVNYYNSVNKTLLGFWVCSAEKTKYYNFSLF